MPKPFFDAVKLLGVTNVAGVAGVYGPTPYDKRSPGFLHLQPASHESETGRICPQLFRL
ncbi:MAG: hypothetical protein M5U34_40915 [Chloroflexi bacterium]|nr:hypothetical protein [Chloroflexota bacterium]